MSIESAVAPAPNDHLGPGDGAHRKWRRVHGLQVKKNKSFF
jgi:hypothetical protein